MSAFKPWKLLHVELSDGVPALPAESETQGVYVVFWGHGVPLGQELIPTAELPMSVPRLVERVLRAITPAVGDRLLEQGFRAPRFVLPKDQPRDFPPEPSALLALDEPLARLRERMLQGESESSPASVSVIVCTRDRPEQLEGCLRSLQRLSRRPGEILVVDNAPRSDGTRRLVERMPGIRYLLEPRPGLSAARNAGIRDSTGEMIAFTDDDVVVHPDWIARLEQGFASPEVMAVTGLVLPAELETEAQFSFQRSHAGFGWGFRAQTFDSRFFEGMKHRGVPVWHIGAGANMAFRREAFRRVGLFDERLGAGASGCSEDSEMWYRILAEGWLCRYEPSAVVHHYHRIDLAGLKHQMHHYMRGHVAALLVQWEKYGHWGNLRRVFGVLPGYYAKLALRRTLGGARIEADTRTDTLGTQVLGCALGVKFYLQNRHSTDEFRAPPMPGSTDRLASPSLAQTKPADG